MSMDSEIETLREHLIVPVIEHLQFERMRCVLCDGYGPMHDANRASVPHLPECVFTSLARTWTDARVQAEIADQVGVERQRCADIVQAARFDEVDRDWRAIISMIEGGRTVEEMKGPF